MTSLNAFEDGFHFEADEVGVAEGGGGWSLDEDVMAMASKKQVISGWGKVFLIRTDQGEKENQEWKNEKNVFSKNKELYSLVQPCDLFRMPLYRGIHTLHQLFFVSSLVIALTHATRTKEANLIMCVQT